MPGATCAALMPSNRSPAGKTSKATERMEVLGGALQPVEHLGDSGCSVPMFVPVACCLREVAGIWNRVRVCLPSAFPSPTTNTTSYLEASPQQTCE